jgi:hypothetical protein
MSISSVTRPAYRVWFRLDGIVTGLNAVAYLAMRIGVDHSIDGFSER